MTTYNQPTSTPTRKVKAAGLGGLVLGVPVATPLANLTMAGLVAAFPGFIDQVSPFITPSTLTSSIASCYMLVIALASAYFTREAA